MTNVLDIAKGYVAANFSVIPIKTDGSKAPLVDWKKYQSQIAIEEELEQWFNHGTTSGIGIVCGRVSGNLEVIDFDVEELAAIWLQRVQQAGISNILLNRLLAVRTPAGWHIYYRCPDGVEGSKKLALRKGGDGKVNVLIETRGSGAYVIAPGSLASCHPDNKTYILRQGDWLDIPEISADDREIFLNVASSFNEVFQEIYTPKEAKLSDGILPGDDFNNRADWRTDILLPAGCTEIGSKSEESYWIKPNSKSKAPHATLNYQGTGKFYVFSTSFANLEGGRFYTKFQLFTYLVHHGDFAASAKDLAKKGYGSKPTIVKWPEPVLFDKIDTPDIASAFLPKWLADYIEALTQSAQVPPALPAMQILAVLATALQKKFEVCPFGDSYTEPLCIWTINVLPPSTRKSRIVTELTRPLNKYEIDEATRLKSKIAKHTAEQKALKKRIEELEKRAGKSNDEAERKALIDEMALLQEKLEEPLLEPRLWTGDVTPERLQNLMAEHGGKMAVLSDEGGIFEIMAGLYNDGKANLDIFLKAHSGSAVRVDRGSRTVKLDDPALTFGITVQPQIISEFSQGSKRRFRGTGTCARFLWSIPKSNIGKRDIRNRMSIPGQITTDYETGILNLLKITQAVAEDGNQKPWKLILSDEARECWLQFVQYVEAQQDDGGALEVIQDWSGKLPGAALRIAGLLHVGEYGRTGTKEPSEYQVISKETMENALELCKLLIEHAKVAFGYIGADPAIEDAKSAFQWITKEQRESFKQTDLLRTGKFNKSKVDRLHKALEILRDRHIISDARREDTPRKPTIFYDVNPGIYAETNYEQP